jgi:hypothetical protein
MPFDRVNGHKNIGGLRLFVLYVHQNAHAQFTSNDIVSRMERALFVTGVCSGLGSCGLSSTPRDWAVTPAGTRFLRNKRTKFRNDERVERPSLATLSAIILGRNHKQRTRIIDCNLITHPSSNKL